MIYCAFNASRQALCVWMGSSRCLCVSACLFFIFSFLLGNKEQPNNVFSIPVCASVWVGFEESRISAANTRSTSDARNHYFLDTRWQREKLTHTHSSPRKRPAEKKCIYHEKRRSKSLRFVQNGWRWMKMSLTHKKKSLLYQKPVLWIKCIAPYPSA